MVDKNGKLLMITVFIRRFEKHPSQLM